MIISARLINLTIPHQGKTAKIEKTHNLSKRVKRADIIDRNGIIIATSLPTVNLYAVPPNIMNLKISAKKITLPKNSPKKQHN